MKILNNIQFLRGFAALNVLLFHLLGFTYANTQFKGTLFNFLEGWGENGVDLFFVISGFIMVYVQNFKNRGTKNFLLDRVVRIVPSYWILIILLAFASFFLPTSFNAVIFNIKHIIASMMFVFQPLYHDVPFVMVGWTLEFEMLFYLIFGLSLFFSVSKKSLMLSSILILTIAFVFKQYIMLEFLYGMIIGIIFLKHDLSRYGIYFLIAGFILLFASIGLDQHFLTKYRILLSGIPSFMIVLGAVYMKQLNSSPLKLLGDISYSLYLTHYLLIPAFYKLFTLSNLTQYLNPLLNDVLAVFIIFLITFCGYIYFILVEKPVTNYLKKKFL